MFSTHSVDKDGTPVLWVKVRARSYEHDDILVLPLFRQLKIYNFDKTDRFCKNRGWALVVDMSEAGVSITDRANTEFAVNLMVKYFPRAVKYMAVVDQPWLLRTVLRVIINFLDEELRSLAKFISSDELVKYMHLQYIPVQLNGSFAQPFDIIPQGVRPFKELANK